MIREWVLIFSQIIACVFSRETFWEKTFGQASIINDAEIVSSNQTFVVTPNSLNKIDPLNNIITQSYSISSNFQKSVSFIPLEADKVILLCESAFIKVINSKGTVSGNYQSYQNNNNFILSKCSGSLNNNNILIVGYEERANDYIYYYFYFYSFNKNTYSFSAIKSFSITKICWSCSQDFRKWISCSFFDRTNQFICIYFENYDLYAGLISDDWTSIINEKLLVDIVYDQRLLKLSPEKIFVYYGLKFMSILTLENNEIISNQVILNNTSTKEKGIFAPVDQSNLFFACFNAYYIEFAYVSLEKSTISTYQLYYSNNNIKALYITSYSPILFNMIYVNNSMAYSLIIKEPDCKSLLVRTKKQVKTDILFKEITSSSPDDSSVIIDSKDEPKGAYMVNADLTITYLALSNDPTDQMYYSIKEDKYYSKKCRIDFIICNDACEECFTYSDDEYYSQCFSCSTNYYPLVDDSTRCFSKDKDVEYYYLDKSINVFYHCYSTCLFCNELGDFNDHKCTACKDDLIFSFDLKQCICDITKLLWYKENDIYFCLNNNFCPQQYPLQVLETNQCVTNCPQNTKEYLSICYESCPEGTIDLGLICQTFQEMVSKIEDNIQDIYNSTPIINADNSTIEIIDTERGSVSNQKNISSIDLGECEAILKRSYGIPENESLIIMKIDTATKRSITNKVEYKVYSKSGVKLDLSLCNEAEISLSVPINVPEDIDIGIEKAETLAQQGYDIYNSDDPFYNDICATFTSEYNTDVPLEDRKKDYYYQNVSFCEEGCEYNGINLESMTVNCSCVPKHQEEFDPDTLSINEIGMKFKTVLSNSNIRVFLCYQSLFKSIAANWGNWIMLGLIMIEIILMIIYCKSGLTPIIKVIKDILKERVENLNSNKETVTTNNVISSSKPVLSSTDTTGASPDIKRKLQSIEEEYVNNDILNLNESVKNNDQDKENEQELEQEHQKDQEQEYSREFKNDIENEIISIKKRKQFYDKNTALIITRPLGRKSYSLSSSSSNNCLIGNEHINLKESKFKNQKDLPPVPTITRANSQTDPPLIKKNYTNEELSKLEFDEAVIHDKRKFCMMYYHHLQYKQLILFTFVVKTDFNLVLLKVSLFFFSLSMLIAFNTLFYDDDTMSHTYHNKGKFDFLYSLPQTIFSSLVCGIISFLLEFLSLSQDNIQQIKDEEDNEKAGNLSVKILKKLKIKIVIFYIILMLLMILFWYYVSAFCAVYKNTQKHLFIDSFISFGLGMIYPFPISFLTIVFRYYALTKKSKCLFIVGKLLSIF